MTASRSSLRRKTSAMNWQGERRNESFASTTTETEPESGPMPTAGLGSIAGAIARDDELPNGQYLVFRWWYPSRELYGMVGMILVRP